MKETNAAVKSEERAWSARAPAALFNLQFAMADLQWPICNSPPRVGWLGRVRSTGRVAPATRGCAMCAQFVDRAAIKWNEKK